jgi:hypothetical protein
MTMETSTLADVKENPDIACYATARAFLDMMLALGYSCKRDFDVNRQQVADVLMKYLRDRPADRHDVPAFSAILAFEESRGCSRKP